MNTEVQDGIGWLTLTCRKSFFSEEGHQEVSEMLQFIRDPGMMAELQYLVIHQNFSSLSPDTAYLADMESITLLAEWVKRVIRFRELRRKLMTLPVPVIFTCEGDCFSSHWELALSAGTRIWFSRNSLTGFPELQQHLLPPGGTLDSLSGQTEKEREGCLKNPVSGVLDATRQGLITFYGGTISSRETISKWLGNYSQQLRPLSLSQVPEEELFPLPWNEIARQEEAWQQLRKLRPNESPVDQILGLARAKKSQDANLLNNHIVAVSGRYYLHPAWIRGLRHQEIPHQARGVLSPAGPVYIEAQDWAPPVHAVAALLRAGCYMVFFAEKSKELSEVLERIVLKIERLEEKKELIRLWQERVSWFTGDKPGQNLIRLKWGPGETLEISCHGFDHTLLNLESNFINSEPGFLEILQPWLLKESPPVIRQLLKTISKGIVESCYMAPEVPASTWIRLMFLQELLELSRQHKCDMNLLLNSLQECGWGFIGSEPRWGYFLQTRQGHLPDHGGIVMPDPEVWDPGRWKHVLASLNSTKKKRKKDWHLTGVSHHLALLCMTMVDYMIDLGKINCRLAAATLVSEAAGFPAGLVSPDSFSRFWGIRRYLLYRERHWPDLVPQGRKLSATGTSF